MTGIIRLTPHGVSGLKLYFLASKRLAPDGLTPHGVSGLKFNDAALRSYLDERLTPHGVSGLKCYRRCIDSGDLVVSPRMG